jgi:hypothetical protein
MWNGRQRELLSDQEWVGFFFSTLVRDVLDIREQFSLSLEDGSHELSAYQVNASQHIYPGTLELAKQLGFRHPKVTDKADKSEWVMTTDLLLALKRPSGKFELLAVAFKPAGELSKKRTMELLSIERKYWAVRGVQWLLISPEQYDERVGLTLRRSLPWALGSAVSKADILVAADVLEKHPGCSLSHFIEQLSAIFGCVDHAQRAFWQAVWRGEIHMDLRCGWRPHLPIVLLSEAAFLDQNPIESRRSAWN